MNDEQLFYRDMSIFETSYVVPVKCAFKKGVNILNELEISI